MTTVPIAPDEAGFDLALCFEHEAEGENGRVILFACCWLLAGLGRQAERETQTPPADSMAVIVRHLIEMVDRLRTAYGQTAVRH